MADLSERLHETPKKPVGKGRGAALEEIRALLAAQNALLLDILGAVNARTALDLAAKAQTKK